MSGLKRSGMFSCCPGKEAMTNYGKKALEWTGVSLGAGVVGVGGFVGMQEIYHQYGPITLQAVNQTVEQLGNATATCIYNGQGALVDTLWKTALPAAGGVVVFALALTAVVQAGAYCMSQRKDYDNLDNQGDDRSSSPLHRGGQA